MHKIIIILTIAVLAAAPVFLPAPAAASIVGLTGTPGPSGTTFSFTAEQDYVQTFEGGVLQIWGLANGAGRPQYPAPTLILYQGQTVSITLTNQLPANTSLVFPGMSNVQASGGVPGILAQEAEAASATAVTLNVVTYTFTADRPGTYQYHSGTDPDLQVEMGLVGAIVVYPAGYPAGGMTAYGTPETAFDREYLFVISEMDPYVHFVVEFLGAAALANYDYLATYKPNYWFINGRTAMDTMAADNAGYLPTQPYGALALAEPGDRVLMRVVGGNRDLHPFHHHGAHSTTIARDGRLLSTTTGPDSTADLRQTQFTLQTAPGQTIDSIYKWTGEKLSWDIYGPGPHDCKPGADGFDPTTREYCADHGKPLPVVLPEQKFLTNGGLYSGSPFLGSLGVLPPGEGGLNPWGGFSYMWHSHTEAELVNFDLFPGGLMTMLVIVPRGTLDAPMAM